LGSLDGGKIMISKLSWIAEHAGLNQRTFQGGITKGIMPKADQVVLIAEALNTTVEYLVTGKHPGQWRPPDRIADIVEALGVLSDSDLGFIRKALKAVAEQTEREKESRSHTG